MGARSEHQPGMFSWVDLSTYDVPAAKEFYGTLLGWRFEDTEIPGGGTYTMCRVGDDEVGAIAQATDRFPPSWNSYVTVLSADDAAAKARELGASVVVEPIDVMDAGRTATFADPAGAALCVWEPHESIGATRVNDLGCLMLNELHTADPAKALEFYFGLFGWGTEPMESEDRPEYKVITLDGRLNGGVFGVRGLEPPGWIPYFTVPDRDGAAEETKEMGARELFRTDLEGEGGIAIFADPQGARFAVFDGEVDE